MHKTNLMRRLAWIPLLLLTACDPAPVELTPTNTYVPIYAAIDYSAPVAVQAAKPTAKASKIYAYGSYAFQVDQYTGIHIIANAGTATAAKIAFLQVPLCTEIAIRNNYLYTNHNSDLVVFDLSNPAAPKLVKRLDNAFPVVAQEFPPLSNVYFECPDPAKGVVVGWEQKPVDKPNCRR